jgi:hypothetical protein
MQLHQYGGRRERNSSLFPQHQLITAGQHQLITAGAQSGYCRRVVLHHSTSNCQPRDHKCGEPYKITQPAPSKMTDGEMLILQHSFQKYMTGIQTIKTAICSTNIYDYIKAHSQDGRSINLSKNLH